MDQRSPPATEPGTAAALGAPVWPFDLARRLAAEALGTGLLVAIVIGSGIMGERLAGGNTALALLGNTLATGAGLVVLVAALGPLSGAHFNPAVTLARSLSDSFAGIAPSSVHAFLLAQLAGAVTAAALCGWLFRERHAR